MNKTSWPLPNILLAVAAMVIAGALFGSVGFYAVLVYVIYLASKH